MKRGKGLRIGGEKEREIKEVVALGKKVQ